MSYQVKTEKFEGPLDVLLNFIEEKKLSITEISLAQVCQDYLVYLKTLKDLPRAEAASFLAVGATLMLIKSRSLIPSLEVTREEEESIEELEIRLKLLKEFRSLAKNIRDCSSQGRHLFSREAFAGFEFGFIPPAKISPSFLERIAKLLIETLPRPDLLPEKTLAKIITIEQKSRELVNRIQEHFSGPLERIISAKDKSELIVGFLALLELIKQGFFSAEQKGLFGEVELRKAVSL